MIMYSITSHWCEECESSFPDCCNQHGVINLVSDAKQPSKAYYTLPNQLYIQKLRVGGKRFAIFAKETIQARSQFGPVDAPLDFGPSSQKSGSFELKVKDDGCWVNLDLENAEECNWMMFVRPASCPEDQNLAAIYHDNKIYYLSTKVINKESELRVWYGMKYADKIGKHFLVQPTLLRGQPTKPNTLNTEPSDLPDNEDILGDSNLNDADFKPNRRLDSGTSKRKRRPRKASIGEKITNRRKSTTGSKLRKSVVKVIRTENKKRTKSEVKKERSEKKARYICEICDEGFQREGIYKIHVASHTGTLPFICQFEGCNKGFKNKFLFYRHQIIHQDYLTLSCLYCDKSFRRKDHLKNHMQVHDSKRKSWTCEQCNKSYMRFESFRFHQAMHHARESKTPHCLLCKKDFDSEKELVTHLNNIHNRYHTTIGRERKKKCTQCDKMFLCNKEVQRHMITHTKKKEFLCEICSQVFGRKDHLARHIKSAHPNGIVRKPKLLKKTKNSVKDVLGSSRNEEGLDSSLSLPFPINQTISLIMQNPNEETHQGRFIPPSYEDVTRKPEISDPSSVPSIISAVNFSTQGLVSLLDTDGRPGSHTLPLTHPNNSTIQQEFLDSASSASQNNQYYSVTDHSYLVNMPRTSYIIPPVSSTISQSKGELLWDSEELRKREYETAGYLQSFASGCALSGSSMNEPTTSSGTTGQSGQLTWDTVLSYAKQLSSTSSNQISVNNTANIINNTTNIT